MASALQVSAFVGAPVVAKPVARAQRAAVPAVSCSAQGPAKFARQAASLAAAAVLTLSSPAFAVIAPVLQDDTKLNERVQLSYEARNDYISEKPRGDGPSRFAFQKLDTAATKARAAESIKRVKVDVADYVSKKYWTQAGNELRRQVGTLRFDLANLADAKGAGKYEVSTLVKSIEDLDFSIRKKSPEAAAAAIASVTSAAAAVTASLL